MRYIKWTRACVLPFALVVSFSVGCENDQRGAWNLHLDASIEEDVGQSEDILCEPMELPKLSGESDATSTDGSPYCGVPGDEHCFQGSTYSCRSDGTSDLVHDDCCEVSYRQIYLSEVNDWAVSKQPDASRCGEPNTSGTWAFDVQFTVKNGGSIRTTPECYPAVCAGNWSDCYVERSMWQTPSEWARRGIGPVQSTFLMEEPTLSPGETVRLTSDEFRLKSNSCAVSVILFCDPAPSPELVGPQPYRNDCTLSKTNSSSKPVSPLEMSDCMESTPSATPLREFTVGGDR